MSGHRIDFGPEGSALDLVDADRMARKRAFWFRTSTNGFDLGSAEAVRVIVASLIRDGDDERIQRYGNRTITLDVQVKALDPNGLGLGERALSLLVGTRSLLRWTPPGSLGSLTRFVVVTSFLAPVPNDIAEVVGQEKTRTWRLTLICEPHGTSEKSITAVFQPSTVEPAVVDDGSSVARWAVNDGQTTLSASTFGDGTSVRGDTTAIVGSRIRRTVTFTPAAPITANFIGVDVAGSDGFEILGADPVSVEPTGSYTRYWFRNPGGTALALQLFRDRRASAGTPGLYVPWVFHLGGFYATNTLNARGLLATPIEGSVRTTGTLTVTRGTAMAWLAAYTDPAMLTHGYSPAVSASWAQAPKGRYQLAVRGGAIAEATGTVSATITDETGAAQSVETVLTAATATFRSLGEFQLGSRRDGLLGPLSVALTRDGAAVDPATVETRLYRMGEDTTLTVVEPAAPVTSFVIEPPSLDNPIGGLWADDHSAEHRATSWEDPDLEPGVAAVLIETNNSATAPVSSTLQYWSRWRTFAP